MKKKCLLTIAACALMFAACGDDVTEVTEIHQDGMAVLEKGEKLLKQACDTTNVGEMLFVMDSSEAFICDGESWQTFKGEKGADGKDGKDGQNGNNGNDGTSFTAQSVMNAAGLKGLEVTCGETVIDTIWNGSNGADGKGCSAIDNSDGTVKVTCGEGEGATTTTVYKAVCGTEPYDPEKAFCSDGELYDLCGGKMYDPKKQFCDTRDNQIYGYVTIAVGDYAETWMAENLNYDPGDVSGMGEYAWSGCYGDGGCKLLQVRSPLHLGCGS